MKSLEECAKKVTSQKLSVLIFPEGTRNHGDGMLEFKKGAFNVAVFVSFSIRSFLQVLKIAVLDIVFSIFSS